MKCSIAFPSSIFFGADVSKGWYYFIDSTALVKKHLKTTLDCNSGGGFIINYVSEECKCYLTDIESSDDAFVAFAEFNDPHKTFLFRC